MSEDVCFNLYYFVQSEQKTVGVTSFSARTIYAYLLLMFVTGTMIASIIQTKRNVVGLLFHCVFIKDLKLFVF